MRSIISDETFVKHGFMTSLRYEQLKEWEVGQAVIKDAVDRWTPLGFLDGIEDETKKEVLAVAFDNMANDLLKENEKVVKIEKRYNFNCAPDDESKQGSFEFDVVVFPIIRRIICGVNGTRFDGIGELFSYDKFLEYLDDLSFLAINYDGYEKECDFEAEFAAIISHLIEERFYNENIKN